MRYSSYCARSKTKMSWGYQIQSTQFKKLQKYQPRKRYLRMMIHLMIQNIVMKSITMMRNSGKEMEETLHKLQIAINWPRPFGQADDIKGSGVLKSKHLVLTCVYNFYFNRKLVDKNKVKIYLAPCGELINSLQVQSIYIPYEYKAKKKASYDYTLVKHKEHTKLEGFIPLRCDTLQRIQTELIGIYGYPQISYTIIKYQKNQRVEQYGLMRNERIPQDIEKKICYFIEFRQKIDKIEAQFRSKKIRQQRNLSCISSHSQKSFYFLNGQY